MNYKSKTTKSREKLDPLPESGAVSKPLHCVLKSAKLGWNQGHGIDILY